MESVEHVELPESPTDVEAMHEALRAADRRTPAVPRVPTQRPTGEPLGHDYAATEDSVPVRVPPPASEAAFPEHEYAEQPPDEHYVPPPGETYAPSVPPSAAPSRRPTFRPTPSEAIERYRESGPGALALEDAERERNERFGELERQMTDTLGTLEEAETARDQAFRGNEDDRQRIFEDHEAQRDQEAVERRDAMWRELEDRLANIVQQVPLPVPPPPEPGAEPEVAAPEEELPPPEVPAEVPGERPADLQSVVESIRSVAQDAASRHAQDILETVRLEREELMRERELAQAERERAQAESEAARARYNEDREARIRALEEELAAVRSELENERLLRATEETERRERERIETMDRDEAMRAQLSDITNLVSEQRDELQRKRELTEQHWAEKERWMEQCNDANAELRQLVQQVIEERAVDKADWDADREARANDPSVQSVLDEMAAFRNQQDELLRQMADSWRADCARQHEETLAAVRSTASEQVPFNIQGYLDEFSRSLAAEVRMLLGEVGRLREERRNIQYELGCLLTMKSKMGPGGEFDPEWRPPTGACARDGQPAGPSEAPPEAPPPDEPPQPARPAWRSVMQRGSRRSRRSQAAPPPPPEPVPEVRPPIESWATWQPNAQFVPTPPPNPPTTLLVPDQSSPGLFGPRSPRSSIHR
ncbi:uncharacterized protein C8Q71DRAFT_443147 [Rhodofomes roseus]|uniref:Uncharacterized protein n=1 Tax=Rhodofomes roseus TaxID=34475 RepID=A0ABQ8JYA1_9APHY|nr:uncharacterized protein C8Q71DRAFT_443147 [Rhodofomes roseus]KAH9829235.1 hypothetical protein C8Q71DRAFT_443147 [Rhodofomes roseus]